MDLALLRGGSVRIAYHPVITPAQEKVGPDNTILLLYIDHARLWGARVHWEGTLVGALQPCIPAS
jgi:hypothetical protein